MTRGDPSTWLSVRLWNVLHPTLPQRGLELAALLGEDPGTVLRVLAYMVQQGTAERSGWGRYLRAGLRPDRILPRRIVPDERRARIAEARRQVGRATRERLRERILALLSPDVDLVCRELLESLNCSHTTLENALRGLRADGLVLSSRRGYRLAHEPRGREPDADKPCPPPAKAAATKLGPVRSHLLSMRLWEALDAKRPRTVKELTAAVGGQRHRVQRLVMYMARQGTARHVGHNQYLRAALRPDRPLPKPSLSVEKQAALLEVNRRRARAFREALRERTLACLSAEDDLLFRPLLAQVGGSHWPLRKVLQELRVEGLVTYSLRGYRLTRRATSSQAVPAVLTKRP